MASLINRVISVIAAIVLLLLSIAVSWMAGRKLGQVEGSTSCTQQYQLEQIQEQDQILGQVKLMASEAQKASLEISAIIHKRQAADERTTKTLRDTLNKTSNQRVICVFDADVMQQLDTARLRANTAATSGITVAVPATTGTDE